MTPTVTDDFVNFSAFSVDPCETIQIKRYKSSKTGLTAVHADIEGFLNIFKNCIVSVLNHHHHSMIGPLVSGFLALATKGILKHTQTMKKT